MASPNQIERAEEPGVDDERHVLQRERGDEGLRREHVREPRELDDVQADAPAAREHEHAESPEGVARKAAREEGILDRKDMAGAGGAAAEPRVERLSPGAPANERGEPRRRESLESAEHGRAAYQSSSRIA
jgi:hypothetical protein